MVIERKFIDDAVKKYLVTKYLENELERAGFSKVLIQRTPLVTRISVETTKPGRVIGKGGKNISELTSKIQNEFNIKNPEIGCIEVRDRNLVPRLVAKRACAYIEMGKKVRSILHYLLREIMNSGAIGAEIVASGKIGAKGARAKRVRVQAGYIPKAGDPALTLVDSAHITASTKSGSIGVLVRIAPPGTVFPDKVKSLEKKEEERPEQKPQDKKPEQKPQDKKPEQENTTKSKEDKTIKQEDKKKEGEK